MPILFLIVFIDLLGFGLLMPLFPYVAERLGASPFWVTFGGPGIYSLCQLLATPLWGRLSDAYGRKPILVLSMLGSALAYVALAGSESLWLLVVARGFQGAMAGNVSAAFAYAADVSEPANRARSLGVVGAAFGLGFTIGPAVGGLLGGSDVSRINFTLPALFAAALSAVAVVLAALFLRESLDAAHRRPFGAARVSADAGSDGRTSSGGGPFAILAGRRGLTLLVLSTLLLQSATALVQSTYPLWAHRIYGHGPLQVGAAFFALGMLSVIFQLGFVGPLARALGENRVASTGAAAMAAGILILTAAGGPAMMWTALALIGAGLGLYSPSISSLVSQFAAPAERGAVMGAYNAANSLARIVGPTIAGPLFSGHLSAPFLVAALLVLGSIPLMGTRPVPESAQLGG